MHYEINYLVLQSKTAELDQIREDIKKLVESAGGKLEGEKNYLKRKLAYEIKHENYGFFTVLRFETESENVAKLKRELNLSGNVTRYIIVKTDELPPLDQAPTPSETTQEAAAATESPKDALEKIISQPKVTEKVAVPKEETPAAAKQEEAPAQTEKIEQKKTEPVAEEKQPQPAAQPKKEEEKKQAPKEDKKKTEAKEDDKASLEELDKKLDEILNI